MALYTLQCYTVFGKKDEDAREYLFLRQNMLMFAMHFVAFTVLYLAADRADTSAVLRCAGALSGGSAYPVPESVSAGFPSADQ